MPTIENALPPNDSGFSHPPLLHSETAPPDRLKALLLNLSRQPEYGEYRSILRSAADSVREKAFGYNRQTTRKKILKLLNEFHCLEIDDLTDETRISEKEIRAALDDLIAEEKVIRGQRRRWQEPGKHYNAVYYLKSAMMS